MDVIWVCIEACWLFKWGLDTPRAFESRLFGWSFAGHPCIFLIDGIDIYYWPYYYELLIDTHSVTSHMYRSRHKRVGCLCKYVSLAQMIAISCGVLICVPLIWFRGFLYLNMYKQQAVPGFWKYNSNTFARKLAVVTALNSGYEKRGVYFKFYSVQLTPPHSKHYRHTKHMLPHNHDGW